MQDRIVDFITRHSKVEAETFREMMMNTSELVMDVGSVVEGEDAVKLGLIDSLGGLGDALECLYDMIENSPQRY